MTGNLWASALVALLFAIHSLRTEAVAWVGERKSPLSGLFFASTIAAYAAYARRPFSLVRYLLVAAFFALGLLCRLAVVSRRAGAHDRVRADRITHYRAVLKVRPDDVGALNNTAWLLATHPDPKVRNGAEAVALARRAAELTPGDPNSLGTLAAACAEAGRFAEAVRTARQAVDLARRQGDLALAASIQAKIRLYEAKTPFHESPSAPAESSRQR